MRRLVLGFTALALAVSPAAALEDQWGWGTITTGWHYAAYTTAKRTVTLYCHANEKLHEFIYGMPLADLPDVFGKLNYADLVLTVRTRDATSDHIETAVADVEITANMISFKVSGQRAWELQSAFGYSDYVKVGVAERYNPDRPEIEAPMTYLTRTRATEEAVFSVMGPCVPDGYNDRPPSSEEPPAVEPPAAAPPASVEPPPPNGGGAGIGGKIGGGNAGGAGGDGAGEGGGTGISR